MANFIAEDMVQLSSNGDMVVGGKEIIKSYSEHEFRNPDFVSYERTPDTVSISDNGRFGVERGHWRGRFRVTGGAVTGNAGLYQAGWIKFSTACRSGGPAICANSIRSMRRVQGRPSGATIASWLAR